MACKRLLVFMALFLATVLADHRRNSHRSGESQETDYDYSAHSSSTSHSNHGTGGTTNTGLGGSQAHRGQSAVIGPSGIQASQGGRTAIIGQNGMQAFNGGDTAIIRPDGIFAQSAGGSSSGGNTAIITGNGNGGPLMGGLPSNIMGLHSNLMGMTGSMLSGLMGSGSQSGGQSGGSINSAINSGTSGISHGGIVSSNGNIINGGGTVVSSNNGGTVMTSGGSGISQVCTNNVCRTCFNGRCFNRTYPAIRQQEMCAPAACEYGCIEFVIAGDDNCPSCRCKGFSTKELCESNSDCDKGGHCEKQLCRYPAITGKYTPVCDFSYQCPADQECTNGRCGPSSNKRSHAFTPCVFAYQCPAGFGICESMTCWRDGSGGNTDGTNANTNPDHVSGIACTFDYQCPSRYSCRGMSCVRTGESHGTTACALDSQCGFGERCINMTCKRPRGR